MPSNYPDALKQYKKYKSMGGAFVLARNGSTWDFQIHPKVMIPRIKAIAREAKGQIIAGKWSFAGGSTNFEITFKKGKLTLNDLVKRTLKNGLELGVMPTISEGSEVEDDDQGPTGKTEPESSPAPAPFEFAGLGALDAMLKKRVATQEAEVVTETAFEGMGGLDILSEIDLENGSFTGSVKDIAMARLAWVQAEKEAQVLLGRLAQSILKDFPEEIAASKGVEAAIETVKGGDLVDALDELSNAKGNEDVEAVQKAIASVNEQLDDYEAFVKADPVLMHIDRSPYKVGSVRDRLMIGIAAIRKNIPAR